MKAEVLAREVFVPSPRPGVAVLASSYHARRDGGDLISIHGHMSRSDTVDVAYVRRSEDNGRTWGETTEFPTRFEARGGTGRRHPSGGYVDPPTGRYVSVWTEGVLPNDEPLQGMRRWTIHYAVSEDGGRTDLFRGQIIHEGPDYDAFHHLPGVTVGRNCVMMGDLGQRPLTRADGAILLPVQSSPAGPDGDYWNPGGGFTYTDCLLLIGRWKADGRLAWTASDRIVGDPRRTTRGLIEPTIAELEDGAILMVMRGSNDRRPDLPGHKWAARSRDGGQTWSVPEPWTCEDGKAFYSPSACSQLIPWPDGCLLWMGNICAQNPSSNSPRYPMMLCEVDRRRGLVLRDSVTVIDDRRPRESDGMTLSNFYAREDRQTGHLLLHMSRLFAAGRDWTADALLYRIAVH
jgi:hypothetical protein